jgi:hypothetical protein
VPAIGAEAWERNLRALCGDLAGRLEHPAVVKQYAFIRGIARVRQDPRSWSEQCQDKSQRGEKEGGEFRWRVHCAPKKFGARASYIEGL